MQSAEKAEKSLVVTRSIISSLLQFFFSFYSSFTLPVCTCYESRIATNCGIVVSSCEYDDVFNVIIMLVMLPSQAPFH